MASERSMTMVSERSPVLLTISCCRLGAVCGSCIWVEKSSMSGSNLARSYLVLYNTWQSLGWGMALCQCVLSVWLPEGYQKVYEHSGTFVRCFQLLSALEIVHAATGLVRGSPLTALMQWSGRSNVLFAILHQIPQLWSNPAAAILIYVWSLSEVVRYPWYAASLLHRCPPWLTWLRYSLFIPLYPVGMLVEMVLMAKSLPYLKSQKLNSIALPNAVNFGFDYRLFIQAKAPLVQHALLLTPT
ncbi:hypothetical protein ABBQ38_003397 [Trebouxia sp. C0009 RCD-2024]